MMAEQIVSQVNTKGYFIASGIVPAHQVDLLCQKVSAACAGLRPGARIPELKDESFQGLAWFPGIMDMVRNVIGAEARPVRMLLFDKSRGANWSVQWHQDLSIAVRHRSELDGYTGWSVKDGILHVQPPAQVLESMLTCRIHLDDADLSNGALLVIPGSHRLGRIKESEIHSLVTGGRETVCKVKAGDAMFMKPLILHASRKARSPKHRRVIHVEYAAKELPNSVEWVGL